MHLAPEILGFLITIAALWHVIGFGFGFVYVRLSLLSLLGRIPYQHGWARVLRHADIHLWLSGFLLIGLGMLDKGIGVYAANPKLWCKITVVIVWMVSTQLMRRVGIAQLKCGNKRPMIQLSSINISCWIYGAFLGCAKPLGYGVVSYPTFLLGFALVYLASAVSLTKAARG